MIVNGSFLYDRNHPAGNIIQTVEYMLGGIHSLR